MIKLILTLIEHVPYRTKLIKEATGYYKYPETWSEFIRYIKYRING